MSLVNGAVGGGLVIPPITVVTPANLAAAVAAVQPVGQTIGTSEGSTSTVYAALTTPGPAASLTTLTTALVLLSSTVSDSGSDFVFMSFAISGATIRASADARSTSIVAVAANVQGISAAIWVTGLTPGVNVFTAQYRVAGASTGTWANRSLTVIPGST